MYKVIHNGGRLTLIDAEMRGCESKDARFVHSFGTAGDHRHQSRQFSYERVQFVSSHLFGSVSHLPTTAERKKTKVKFIFAITQLL